MAWLSGQRRDPFLLYAYPFHRAWQPSLGSLWHRVFPISATSVFSFSFWRSGFTLVYQLFDAFSRIGLYGCALELAGATGMVERRMAMSSAQSLGRWQGTFPYFLFAPVRFRSWLRRPFRARFCCELGSDVRFGTNFQALGVTNSGQRLRGKLERLGAVILNSQNVQAGSSTHLGHHLGRQMGLILWFG